MKDIVDQVNSPLEVQIADKRVGENRDYANVYFREPWNVVEVDGCYTGPAAEKFWGDWDHEFGIRIPVSSAPELLKVLRPDEEVSEDDPRVLGRVLAQVLIEEYQGQASAANSLMHVCEEHGIKHEYWAWT